MRINYRAATAFLIHALLCVFLSFDWGGNFGSYFGFFTTFIFLWASSFPLATGVVALVGGLRKKADLLKKTVSVAGGIIILFYLCSFLGIVENLVSISVIIIALLTFFVWCSWVFFAAKKKNK